MSFDRTKGRRGKQAVAAGGGGGAPTTATYLTLTTDATLTAERVLTPGTGLGGTDGGAGAAYTLAINDTGLVSLMAADASAGFPRITAANTWVSESAASHRSALGYSALSEAPTGAVNGVNTTYTLSTTPAEGRAVLVAVNGVLRRNDAAGDYVVSGTTITFAFAPATGSVIWAYFWSATTAATRAAWVAQTTKTANYTALITDDFVPVDATAGNITINLPPAATFTNPINIARIDASGFTVTIDPSGAQTIMGAATYSLVGNANVTLFPVGTDVRIL